MAINHIAINTTPPRGRMLQGTVDGLRQVLDQLDRLLDVANQCWAEGDYTQLELLFGIPTGKGANVLYLLNSLSEKLNTDASVTGMKTAIDALLSQLG